jgi:hypothetical protein
LGDEAIKAGVVGWRFNNLRFILESDTSDDFRQLVSPFNRDRFLLEAAVTTMFTTLYEHQYIAVGCGFARPASSTRSTAHNPCVCRKSDPAIKVLTSYQHTVRYTELSPDRFRDFWRD